MAAWQSGVFSAITACGRSCPPYEFRLNRPVSATFCCIFDTAHAKAARPPDYHRPGTPDTAQATDEHSRA
jgi:hypothetical protein